DREAILRRRATFVASAMAGLVLGACSESRPQPCLNITRVPSPSAEPSPEATPDPTGEPSATAAPEASAAPVPCLDIAVPEQAAATATATATASGSAQPPKLPPTKQPFPA